MNHTANIAIGINALVVDDRGWAVSRYIFPVVLFYIHVPGQIYRLATCYLLRATRYLATWRADLAFMALAVKCLFVNPKNEARRRSRRAGQGETHNSLPSPIITERKLRWRTKN